MRWTAAAPDRQRSPQRLYSARIFRGVANGEQAAAAWTSGRRHGDAWCGRCAKPGAFGRWVPHAALGARRLGAKSLNTWLLLHVHVSRAAAALRTDAEAACGTLRQRCRLLRAAVPKLCYAGAPRPSQRPSVALFPLATATACCSSVCIDAAPFACLQPTHQKAWSRRLCSLVHVLGPRIGYHGRLSGAVAPLIPPRGGLEDPLRLLQIRHAFAFL